MWGVWIRGGQQVDEHYEEDEMSADKNVEGGGLGLHLY